MSIVRVAEVAGVSKSTVSRVINNAPDVDPAIVGVVLAAMKAVGYRPPAVRPGPKPVARRGAKNGGILLLAAGFSAAELYQLPVFPTVLHGIEREAGACGMNLSLASLTPDSGVPAAMVRRSSSPICAGVTTRRIRETPQLRQCSDRAATGSVSRSVRSSSASSSSRNVGSVSVTWSSSAA
jgi:DNA-binding LacI/PurR family transcriptional regulator